MTWHTCALDKHTHTRTLCHQRGRTGDIGSNAALATDPAMGIARAALLEMQELQEECSARQVPCAMLHGDPFLDNVVFSDEGRLEGIVDWEVRPRRRRRPAWRVVAYGVRWQEGVVAHAIGWKCHRLPVHHTLKCSRCMTRVLLPWHAPRSYCFGLSFCQFLGCGLGPSGI